MLQTTALERIFLHKEKGIEVRLNDPGEVFSPEAVLNFYSATYPILTNAQIIGPEIKDDEIQYRFESTMGPKDNAMNKPLKCKTFTKDNSIWHIYQNLGNFTKNLDRRPDATAVRRNGTKSAPLYENQKEI
jgi:PRTRC genetic system protein C